MSPPTGNQPVFTAKINNKIAKKNEGIAIPILAKTVKNLSNTDSFFIAEIIPKGMPTSQVIKITISESKSVFGILSASF